MFLRKVNNPIIGNKNTQYLILRKRKVYFVFIFTFSPVSLFIRILSRLRENKWTNKHNNPPKKYPDNIMILSPGLLNMTSIIFNPKKTTKFTINPSSTFVLKINHHLFYRNRDNIPYKGRMHIPHSLISIKKKVCFVSSIISSFVFSSINILLILF